MRARSFAEYSDMLPEQLSTYECSDRILVCKTQFERMGFSEGGKVMLLHISNQLGKSVVGMVHEFHKEEDILYLPSWMIHTLQATSNLSIASVIQRACTKIILKPMNSGLYDVPDWCYKLNSSLRNYNTMTKGDTIALDIDGLQLFRVEMLYPIQYTTVYLRLQEAIELSLVSSLEDDAKKEYTPTVIKRTVKKDPDYLPIHAFVGTGQRVGGASYDITLSPNTLALEAAKNRMGKK